MPLIKLTIAERNISRAIKRIEKNWPKSLWLFAAAGTLYLMRNGPDGKPVLTNDGYVDPDYKVARFNRIKCDGGDW